MSRLRVDVRWSRPGFDLAAAFDVPGRGFTALFGPSGSGKTTLLRCVAGLERAPQARVELQGECWQDTKRNIFLPAHRRRLGYVFQDAALLDHLTVRGNLEYGYARAPAAERRIAMDQAVDWTGVGHLLGRRALGLSGGERSRVAMARALASSPRLLLMDEPLAALDAAARSEILPYLERLQREVSIPVLYVSHALDEVARLADHLVCLDRGHAVAAGPLAAVLARTDLPLAHTDEASAVIEAAVAERDPEYHLAALAFHGQRLWVADAQLGDTGTVRVRIRARDVSLSLDHHANTSILNILPAVITGMNADRPAQVLVGLDVGGAPLLARITRKSWHDLGLAIGRPVYAQVKSVALLR